MTKIKDKTINLQQERDLLEENPSKDTVEILKKAWNELPSDFTMGERSLFIELAERLVKVAEEKDSRLN